MRYRWLTLTLGLVAGGCGFSGSHDDSAAIRTAVVRSYRTTDASDCSRLFTASFVAAVYTDVAHCRLNVLDRAKSRLRAVSVLSVSQHGSAAAAQVRLGRFAATVRLVRNAGLWQVDDVVSTQLGSSKANLSQARAAATPAPLKARALGSSASFGPIAGIGPDERFSVTVLRVVADGRSRSGARTQRAAATDDFGTITRYRFVNVQVLLSNRGPKPFRGTLDAQIVAGGGQEWGAVVHGGRRPDWTDGEERGIAPGSSAVRWITVRMLASQTPGFVDLIPEVLSKPGTVMAVSPMQARWLAG